MRMLNFLSRLSGFMFATRKRVVGTIFVSQLVVVLVIAGVVLGYVKAGGMRARQDPPEIETVVAHWLVNLSIPDDTKLLKNPLNTSVSGADEAAGRELYQRSCEACHGSDGSGKTQAGAWAYPPPANLRSAEVTHRADGALFYLIRNGIRNSGMPGWSLTDQQTWQLVVFIRNLPEVAAPEPARPAATLAGFVGSEPCRTCHAEIYHRWKSTLMANVVRDPRAQPAAIIADFSTHDPLVTFTPADIAFVYGSKWKQRYFKKVGDDYFPFPAQWDVMHKKWRRYFVEKDWWAPFYPADNFQRPTGPTCDGCHSVNYNVETKTVTEWNVGCEACHGPGSEHVLHPISSTIVNPSRLDYVGASDTCIQCHSQGRPSTNPIRGRYYDWPVGFRMGAKLSELWKLEDHKLGEETFTHFADGTAHKNRMQGNDYVTSQMYTHGVTCFTCHDAHGSKNSALLRKPASELCLDCHGPRSPNGPRAATIESHTHHRAGSAGSECIACHMPAIAPTLGDVNVRSHTFRFVSPSRSEALKIPNACNLCHADKSTTWATAALNGWAERSPWRVAE